MSCAGMLLASVASGCIISRKKETVREPDRSTTVERRSTYDTVPGDTEIRTRTTVERDY
jgi:hypothetical protein